MASSSSLEKTIPRKPTAGGSLDPGNFLPVRLGSSFTQRTLLPSSANFRRCHSAVLPRVPRSNTPPGGIIAGRYSRSHAKCPGPDPRHVPLPPRSALPRCPIGARLSPSPCQQPLRKLKRQQLAEQAPHAHAGVEIAAAPDNVLFLLIISIIWTIERQLHEARERNGALVCLSLPQLFRRASFNCLQCGADLATSRPDDTEFYGEN